MLKRRLIALILWWCEGTKIRRDKRWKDSYIYATEITNTDPAIIKIFVDFLTNDLNISINKLKGQIQIHQGDDQMKYERYWSKYLGLPLRQFNKTIIRPTGTRYRENYGTFKLRTYGKDLYLKLQKMLDNELKDI